VWETAATELLGRDGRSTLDGVKRARDPEQKAERRQAILSAARDLLMSVGFQRLSMARLAREVGVAKGTLYLYFPSREELFLGVLMQELCAWAESVLPGPPPAEPIGPDVLSSTLVESLVRRDVLLQLLAVVNSVLEANISVEAARGFKLSVRDELAAVGRRMEAASPWLQGRSLRVLVHLNALIVGMHSFHRPAPVIERVLQEPELAPMRFDFRTELQAAVEALLTGLRCERPSIG
jgi:AcrR family transcriptional regulator